MIGELIKDRTGKVSNPVSAYQPAKEVADLTSLVKGDYGTGYEILHKPFVEFNDYSVIDRMNKDQRTFNALVDESSEDPSQAWRWKGTRSYARKKAMAMHAQMTANYIMPGVSAQNDEDEEDREMAEVGRHGIEWMVDNSRYRESYFLASMGMLVNPVTFMTAEYQTVMQKVKLKQEDGSYSTKEIKDEVLSGFQAGVKSADQVLITNAYVQNIQKQRAIIQRDYIDYYDAQAQYGDHENWQFVKTGIRTIYSEDDGLFYEVKDENIQHNLVEVVHWKNRRDDSEICFVNGIYMGDADIEANPIKHRDNYGAPKYNVTPFGYHRVNEHFFYYKSLMFELGWDDRLYDAMSELVMNRAALEVDMPIAISGTDKIETDIIFPSAVVSLEDKDSKISPLLPAANFAAGFNAIQQTASSMEEGSVPNIVQGGLPHASQRAYTVALASQGARTMMAAVGKSLGSSVVEFGGLMMDIFINHISAPEVEEILGTGEAKLKYRTFVVSNKEEGGKSISKKVKFDPKMIGAEMSAYEVDSKNLQLLTESGYPNSHTAIIVANPEKFARMKFLIRFDPTEMFAKNEQFTQAMMQNLYTMLRQDPLVDAETLVRKLLYTFMKGEGEDMMANHSASTIANIINQQGGGGQPVAQGQPQGQAPIQGAQQTQAGAMATGKALSTGLGATMPPG